MKFLTILLFVLSGFAQANAQLCGTYGATLKVTDEAGKAVKNTSIRVIPLQDDNYTLGRKFTAEKGDPARFDIFFNEGYFVKGKYKILVAAPGYSPAERETDFPHCARRVFQVVLKRKSGAQSSRSDFLDAVKINGEIYDGKSGVSFVTISATDSDGKLRAVVRTVEDPNGRFNLELPFGTYTLVFQKNGYKTLHVKGVEITERKNVYLYNIALEKGNKREIVVKEYQDLYKSRDIY